MNILLDLRKKKLTINGIEYNSEVVINHPFSSWPDILCSEKHFDIIEKARRLLFQVRPVNQIDLYEIEEAARKQFFWKKDNDTRFLVDADMNLNNELCGAATIAGVGLMYGFTEPEIWEHFDFDTSIKADQLSTYDKMARSRSAIKLFKNSVEGYISYLFSGEKTKAVHGHVITKTALVLNYIGRKG